MWSGFIFGAQIILLLISVIFVSWLSIFWPWLMFLGMVFLVVDVFWMTGASMSVPFMAGFAIAVFGSIFLLLLIIGMVWGIRRLACRDRGA